MRWKKQYCCLLFCYIKINLNDLASKIKHFSSLESVMGTFKKNNKLQADSPVFISKM